MGCEQDQSEHHTGHLQCIVYTVVQSNLAIRNLVALKLFLNLISTDCCHVGLIPPMAGRNVPYPYEVNGKVVTGNGSLIPICSLSKRSLLPSLTVYRLQSWNLVTSCKFLQVIIQIASFVWWWMLLVVCGKRRFPFFWFFFQKTSYIKAQVLAVFSTSRFFLKSCDKL